MDITTLIFLLIPVIVLIYGIAQYNGLVSLRNHIEESWSDVDTELKRRHDLIPNLVTCVKGYAAHENALLERLTALRSQCDALTSSPESQSATETQLTIALEHLLARAEAYPNLKADAGFRKLHQELVNTEDRIQAARRFFNGNVRDYENKRESFPSSAVAQLFNFPPATFFEVEPSVREAPVVELPSRR